MSAGQAGGVGAAVRNPDRRRQTARLRHRRRRRRLNRGVPPVVPGAEALTPTSDAERPAIMASPTSNRPRGPAAVADALTRAKVALDQGRASEAEQIARTVLDKDARNAAALQLLGGALLLQE